MPFRSGPGNTFGTRSPPRNPPHTAGTPTPGRSRGSRWRSTHTIHHWPDKRRLSTLLARSSPCSSHRRIPQRKRRTRRWPSCPGLRCVHTCTCRRSRTPRAPSTAPGTPPCTTRRSTQTHRRGSPSPAKPRSHSGSKARTRCSCCPPSARASRWQSTGSCPTRHTSRRWRSTNACTLRHVRQSRSRPSTRRLCTGHPRTNRRIQSSQAQTRIRSPCPPRKCRCTPPTSSARTHRGRCSPSRRRTSRCS